MRSSRFVDAPPHQLERPNSHVRPRPRIRHSLRIGGKLKNRGKKRQNQFFPETFHHQAAQQRQVIQLSRAKKRHRAAKRVWQELHVGIGKKQQFAARCLVSFLQRVWLS